MYAHQIARDFLLAQNFEVSMLLDLPFVDLSPLVCLEPPGIYYPLEDLLQLFRQISKRLETLSPHPKGSSCVAVASDLRAVVLARTPTPQLSIDLSAESAGVEPLSLKKLAHDEMTYALRALETAEKIAIAQSRGEVSTAEQLSSLLSQSPSPDLVRKALKEMGRDSIDVSIDNQEVTTGGGDPFPAKLAAETVYEASLTIESGVNERDQLTRIRVTNCEPQDEHSIAAKSSRTDIPLDYLEPQDGKLLIAAQFANCKIVAEVCIAIDSFSGRVAAMTLRKIKNREEILSSLKLQVAQGAFAF
jgi:hypothetical protein